MEQRAAALSARIAAVMVAGCVTLIACSSPAPTPTPTPTSTPTPAPAPRPGALPPVRLPADEAPHAYTTEWWYWNVHLSAAGVPRFALHYVLFQVRNPLTGRFVYVAQAALADALPGTHVIAERFASALVQPAPGFRFTADDWLLTSTPSGYALRGTAGDSSFDLDLRIAGPPMLHGQDGVVGLKDAGQTAYFSRPRLDVSGAVIVSGRPVNVTGLAWMDKQWGDFVPAAIGWDWVSVQLDDGRNLMLTRLRHVDGVPIEAYGSLMAPGDGAAERLGGSGFTLAPLARSWTSPATRVAYPTEWRVSVPSHGVDLVLRPLVEASEFIGRSLPVIYYEAGMLAYDVRTGARAGQAFLELTGRPRQ